jgi:cytochrome c peroxidase
MFYSPLALFLVWVCVGQSVEAQVRPTRRTQQAAALGRLLFLDPVLSGNYKRSCASCHRPQKAFTDQRVTARAYAFAENLPTHTPTLMNVSRQRQFFHDGRAGSLERVIEAVLTNPTELNSSYTEVAQRLSSSPTYWRQFRAVYGAGPSARTINHALITYLRQLGTTPQRTQTPLPNAGYRLFAEMGCTTCHPAPDFRDGRRHEIAPGRWVRTPTLRYLALTPPYLTDGSAPTLEAAMTSPFHATFRTLTTTQTQALAHFLAQLPADTTQLAQALPTQLPYIPGAPARRIGGSY